MSADECSSYHCIAHFEYSNQVLTWDVTLTEDALSGDIEVVMVERQARNPEVVVASLSATATLRSHYHWRGDCWVHDAGVQVVPLPILREIAKDQWHVERGGENGPTAESGS